MNPRDLWFAAGFLTGSAGAAAITLLYAPASGQDTLAAIREHVENAKSQAREAGTRAETDVLNRYKALRSASLDSPGPASLAPTPVAATLAGTTRAGKDAGEPAPRSPGPRV